jgi:predicted MFS family arabinose efflux permease
MANVTAVRADVRAEPTSTGAWSAVAAMSLCVFVLIASEFMPVSLLSPIARDLVVSEGQAGQAISISGIFAVVTSLFLAGFTRRIDRRLVLLALTALLAVSGAVVAFAPSYPILMVGRALLGIVIGGFWSMSTSVVMRLVPPSSVPKALAILNGGNALAATVAAPLGSFLGAYIGWRGAFFLVVPLASAALAWQWLALPALRNSKEGKVDTFAAFRVLKHQAVAFGMAAVLLMCMGQYGVYTYFRPFLENTTQVDVSTLSLMLLTIGVTGLIGTALVGRILNLTVSGFLVAVPLLLAIVALGLVFWGSSVALTFVLLGFWGLVSTPSSVGWFTWLSRALPDKAEAGGGLMVAIIQLAITFGAAGGGFLYDIGGHSAAFGASAAVLILGTVVAFVAGRASRS